LEIRDCIKGKNDVARGDVQALFSHGCRDKYEEIFLAELVDDVNLLIQL